jgi:hypothetical protein
MPFLILIFAMIAVFAAVVFAQEQRSKWEEQLRVAAGKLGGTVQPGGLFEATALRFSLKGQSATMRFQDGKHPWTKLEVLLPPPAVGSLKIVPDTIAHSFLRMIGVHEVEIGDQLFDSIYFIQSKPESLAQTIFAPERRPEAMMAVRRLNHCSGFSLTIEGRMLEIRVLEHLDTPALILAMARTAEAFLGFIRPVISSEGIQMGECRDGLCPICAAPLREPLVRCDRCQAPHHQECWEYLGRCATYGCEPKPRRRAA